MRCQECNEKSKVVNSRSFSDDTELAYKDMNFGGSDGEIDQWCVEIDKEKNQLRFESKTYAYLE